MLQLFCHKDVYLSARGRLQMDPAQLRGRAGGCGRGCADRHIWTSLGEDGVLCWCLQPAANEDELIDTIADALPLPTSP